MQARRGEPPRRPQKLPTIAPRQDTTSSSLISAVVPTPTANNPATTPRTRLPPRSRSGCWTCRQRKVKCDEKRPACGQCLRLGHTCDYNPRLAFRDDTPRVKERMYDVQSTGNAVWDSRAPRLDYDLDLSTEDRLPQFSHLTTDEERESKAKMNAPGTYLVIANPGSFSSLPEYAECNDISPSSTFPGRFDPFRPTGSSQLSSSLHESIDPNVIILRNFQDTPRRQSMPTLPSSVTNPISPAASFYSQSLTESELNAERRISLANSLGDGSQSSLLEQARNGGPDAQLLYHYRADVATRVIRVGNQNQEEDLFEREAMHYSPLFHAMMAISALSLAHRSDIPSTAAMVHYGQAITALREADGQNLISDGAMFTHYLLLIYEITHTSPTEFAMWSHHCDALLYIVLERRKIDGIIPHPFIVWLVCNIDAYALLSGGGRGTFVGTLMASGMMPEPFDCLPELGPSQPQHFFPHELPYFPAVLELNQEVVLLAVRIGGMGRDLRMEECKLDSRMNDFGADRMRALNRQTVAHAAQNLCEVSSTIWLGKFPEYWPSMPRGTQLPQRVVDVLEHAHNLYRACVIYASTSLYPDQVVEYTPEYAPGIPHCITEILENSARSIGSGKFELKTLSFSLFMAGFATRDGNEKMFAATLMRRLEPHNFGGNGTSMRILLEHIYSKQLNPETGEYTVCVDWKKEMEDLGYGLIMFGV